MPPFDPAPSPHQLVLAIPEVQDTAASFASSSSSVMDNKFATPEPNHDFSSTMKICVRCCIEPKSPHVEFEWVDHCPAVFRTFLEIWDVDIDDYLVSVRCPDTLKLVTSTKKNSSPVPLVNDDRFLMKVFNKSEMKFVLEMLPKYYHHVQKYKDTLLTRFYGLHVVKPQSGPKVRFAVFRNILRSDVKLHKHFSLRIAANGRAASKLDEELNVAFQLHKSVRLNLLTQLKNDCSFLEELGIMNYCLSLGMHVCPTSFEDIIQGRHASRMSADSDSSKRSSESLPSPTGSAPDLPSDNDSGSSTPTEPEVKLGIKMLARAVDINRKDYLRGAKGKPSGNNVIIYFGLSNILQGYSMLKHVEQVFKSLQSDAPTVPSVNPKAYSTRFQEYISSIFIENDSNGSLL